MSPLHMKRQQGYSLIELLAVLGILAVLAGLAVPLAEVHMQRQRERELKHALWQIRDAIDAYKRAADAGMLGPDVAGSGYPPSLQALVDGTPDLRSGGRRAYFLRKIPRDPFAPAERPAPDTWSVRSHDSPPDRPEPGKDVYDVRSRSTAVGLNGIPLREW